MKTLATFTVLLAAFASRAVAVENPRIEVSAEAETSVRPNQATMHVSVTAVAKNTEQALSELKERVTATRKILKKYKLKDETIQSSEIEVNANVSHLSKKVLKDGYYAKLQLAYTLLDLKQLEELSAKLAEVQGVEFGKPKFGRTDADQIKRENLKKAFSNAQTEGKFIAESLGVKLGSPVFARETESYSGQQFRQFANMPPNLGNQDPFAHVPAQQEAARAVDQLDNVVFVSRVTVHFRIEK